MGCTLRDITNRLYSKKVECVDDEGQEYFYQAQFKNFKDICETLDIADEIKWIKKRGYCFDDRDMGFWCYILENYSDTEMDHLRRAEVDVDKVSDMFVVKLYEGIVNTFINAGVTGVQLEQVMVKLDNRIDYPVRKKRVMISNALDNLDEQIKDINFISASDRYEWLNGFQTALNKLEQEWTVYFDKMIEIRKQEFWGKLTKMENENPEEYEALMAFDGPIEEEVYRQEEEDEEYCDLLRKYKEKCGLLNKKVDAKKSKIPYFSKLQKEVEDLTQAIYKRKDMISRQVIEKYYPEFQQDLYDKAQEILYSQMIPAKEVFKLATGQEYKGEFVKKPQSDSD